MKKIILMLLTVCLSCSYPPPKAPTHQDQNILINRKIYVDSNFTEIEKIEIQKSADEWKHTTNGIVNLDLVYNFDMNDKSNSDPYKYLYKTIIKKISKDSKIVKNIEASLNEQLNEDNEDTEHPITAHIYGYDLKNKNFEYVLIVADRHTNAKELRNTITHELGHMLGMSHYDDGPSVMNVSYEYAIGELIGQKQEPIICLTKHDMMQFCEKYQCDFSKMNYCTK
jgi:hypothetical protein